MVDYQRVCVCVCVVVVLVLVLVVVGVVVVVVAVAVAIVVSVGVFFERGESPCRKRDTTWIRLKKNYPTIPSVCFARL